MRGQRQTVGQDRAAVRQDLKSGNTTQLQQDLSKLRTAQQALRADRNQVGHNERTSHQDDRQLNAVRHTLHRDERAAWLGASRGTSGVADIGSTGGSTNPAVGSNFGATAP